ncbi:MAG: tetratricopeptide repeat protein [Acidobacteriota bacterium]
MQVENIEKENSDLENQPQGNEKHLATTIYWWQRLNTSADIKIIFALVLVAFTTFANSTANRFAYDDHLLIESNYALRDWNYFTKAFTDSHSYDVPWLNFKTSALDYYRPFTRMLFALAYQAFGLRTHYWHLLNVLIYCAVVALAYAIVKRLSASRATAAIGALIFAVHPIHSEAVAWVNCLVETLHALFFLAAFLLYLKADAETVARPRRIFFLGALTLMAGALLSKETALCFPILVAGHRFIYLDTGLVRRVWSAILVALPFLAVVAAYFVLRYFAYGGTLRIVSGLPREVVLLTIPSIILEYLRMMIAPIGLSAVHSVPLVRSFASLQFWLPLLLLTAMGLLLWLRASAKVLFAAAWIAVTMLPILNIGVFTPDLIIQDRYAFLPSLGFAALAAITFTTLLHQERIAKLRLITSGVLIVGIIGLGGLAIRQNRYWYSDLTLFARAVEENSDSEFARCNYASALYAEGKRREAAEQFSFAYQLKRGESGCSCIGLGNYYSDQQNYQQAIPFYQQAIDLREGEVNLLTFVYLAYAYNETGQSDKAIKLLDETIANHTDFSEAYYTRGGILLKVGRLDEGIASLRRALELNPQDAQTHLLLGQAYEERGLRKEAVGHYRLALNIAPDLAPARARLSALEK